MTNGYNFYFSEKTNEELVILTLPITPSELKIKVGSNNKTVTLINGGDINILKSPSLVEVEFDARFPMRKYPYARDFQPFQTYYDKFKDLKENKKAFRFIVTRTTPDGTRTWDTNLLMALEDLDFKESADEGDDVIISFKLKQFKDYGVQTIKLPNAPAKTTSTSTATRGTDGKGEVSSIYTVKSGDCLWNIAKAAYGTGTKNKFIYETNKSVIESEANKRRKGKGSSNGHWIYPGTKLVLPGISNASSLNVKKLK